MTNKKFLIFSVSITLVILVLVGGLTVAVDPLFHYHKPLNNLSYPIHNQRYQNTGIAKNFSYDAIITGTSMTENFKASQFDDLFGVNTVKLSFSGSMFKEQRDMLEKAFNSGNNIKYVVRSVDDYAILADKDARSDFDYPDYLYDKNVLNDVNYFLNKSILFDYTYKVFERTKSSQKTTNFDQYTYWSDYMAYGKEPVIERYTRPDEAQSYAVFTESDFERAKQNVQQNIIDLAKHHPDTQFFLFFPPYSIINWDNWNQMKVIDYKIDVMKSFAELVFECDNISLFSFFDDTDMICDLNNYKDLEHYGGWINEYILNSFKSGEHKLTKENYVEHFNTLRDFYSNYNYSDLMS